MLCAAATLLSVLNKANILGVGKAMQACSFSAKMCNAVAGFGEELRCTCTASCGCAERLDF